MSEICEKIDAIYEEIQTMALESRFKQSKEWGGADVIITHSLDDRVRYFLDNQKFVVGFQKTKPQRRAVITQYSRELSWLFYQLRDAFREHLDSMSKYDFYGLLAQSAIDHIQVNGDEGCEELLYTVLKQGKEFCNGEMMLPKNLELPFFAYGLFKSGQLGFFRIKDFVDNVCETEIEGRLKERDGIPLFDKIPDRYGKKISGHLISFQKGEEKEAYKRIAEIEPKEIYFWGEIEINSMRANILYGKKLEKGSAPLEDMSSWDGRNDPFFSEALEEIDSIIEDVKFSWDSYKPTFRLQMAYGLLWSAIERYAGLRYHFGENSTYKNKQIANEKAFSIALKKYVKKSRRIFRTSKPSEKYTLEINNPEKAIDYYYAVRSNATHRGKAIHQDYDILYNSLTELLAIFRDLLKDAWQEHVEVSKCSG